MTLFVLTVTLSRLLLVLTLILHYATIITAGSKVLLMEGTELLGLFVWDIRRILQIDNNHFVSDWWLIQRFVTVRWLASTENVVLITISKTWRFVIFIDLHFLTLSVTFLLSLFFLLLLELVRSVSQLFLFILLLIVLFLSRFIKRHSLDFIRFTHTTIPFVIIVRANFVFVEFLHTIVVKIFCSFVVAPSRRLLLLRIGLLSFAY